MKCVAYFEGGPADGTYRALPNATREVALFGFERPRPPDPDHTSEFIAVLTHYYVITIPLEEVDIKHPIVYRFDRTERVSS